MKKIDSELNLKITDSIKQILKEDEVSIIFENPDDIIVESCQVVLGDNKFKIFKKLFIKEIDDINIKYERFFSDKVLNEIKDMNQPQSINHIRKNYKKLWFLRPFLGKLIIKNELRYIEYKINYNNIVIDLKKDVYDRMCYYVKYVYKLKQLYKLNNLLGIPYKFDVVFDDDIAAQDMYNSMYNNLGDIIKPRGFNN